MKNAIEKVIKALVGSPDLVEVYEQGDGKNVRFRVRVSPFAVRELPQNLHDIYFLRQ